MKINPCLNCGSTNIKLWDCGYSSFNPGGGTCEDCGREIKTIVAPSPSKVSLVSIWNAENDIPTRLLQINEELLRLSHEKKKLLKIISN